MKTSNTTAYTFYSSRTAARAATTETIKFKDHGADAPKGARWSTYDTAKPAPKLKLVKTDKVAKASKKAAATTLISDMLAEGKERKDVIAKLVAEVGLTAPGASTYYANVKNGTWS